MTADDAELGEELVRLASADNFRDVAGPGYATSDGRRVHRGVLFRSNELTLTDEDADALARLGIATIFDLRDEHEVSAHPDAPVPGAEWRHVEVKGIPMDAVSTLESREQGLSVMGEVYRGFVEKEGGRDAFSLLLREIAAGDGPQLFHCTAGKDRTGWASALLLHVAGVPRERILEDYLTTNTIRRPRAPSTSAWCASTSAPRRSTSTRPSWSPTPPTCRRPTTRSTRRTARSTAISEGLGLDAGTLTALRARLVD